MDAVDLAGLIVARVCHDLAGPMGALANGAELVADEPDPAIRAEFMDLVLDGAAKLGARLRFLRLAYGGAANGPPIRADEARDALAGVIAAEGRMALDWRVGAAELPRDHARLLLLLAMTAADAGEGRATVFVEDAATGVGGGRALLPDEAAAILEGRATGPPPSRLAAPLLARTIADRMGRVLRATSTDDGLRIAIEPG